MQPSEEFRTDDPIQGAAGDGSSGDQRQPIQFAQLASDWMTLYQFAGQFSEEREIPPDVEAAGDRLFGEANRSLPGAIKVEAARVFVHSPGAYVAALLVGVATIYIKVFGARIPGY
jgi:hypothetical protein